MRIAILDDYQGVALSVADWSQLGEDVEIEVLRAHVADEDVLVDVLQQAEVVVAMRERTHITRTLLERLPGLRLVVSVGMRNAAIDLPAAAALGKLVCGTAGATASGAPPPKGNATAELTFGLILSLARNIPADSADVHDGRWQSRIGVALGGKQLGLLGLGNLGMRVARLALAFEMPVVAWSPNLTRERCDDVGVTLVTKEALFATSDFVSVHMVLGDRSRGLVGKDELALMKPTAYLVNTSRGPIVDEDELVAALESNQIAGAGLDVFDLEPLPVDHPLRALPNTVLTPHSGYVTQSFLETAYEQAVEDIAAFRAGAPIRVMTAEAPSGEAGASQNSRRLSRKSS